MKIICVGRNYLKHIKEMGNEMPAAPTLFMKPETALLGDEAEFILPGFSEDLHYEVEVVLKLDRTLKNVTEEEAKGAFSEITLGIDFTARDLQHKMKNAGTSWEIAKAFDHSAVVGRFIAKEEVKDLYDFGFRLEKNKEVVQQASTASMLYKYEDILSYASRFFTLLPGDLIFTGTPEGVGPVASGDVLEGFIENLSLFKTVIV